MQTNLTESLHLLGSGGPGEKWGMPKNSGRSTGESGSSDPFHGAAAADLHETIHYFSVFARHNS